MCPARFAAGPARLPSPLRGPPPPPGSRSTSCPTSFPVAGQLDDAILVVLVLRTGGEEVLREHWPGPEPSRLHVQHPAFSR